MDMPTHYRIVERLEPDGVEVRVEKWNPIKETPQGYWVVSQYAPSWLSADELRKRKFAKWVSKTSHKRKCYPTIEQAIDSYRRRKQMQVSRLRYQIEQAEVALAWATETKGIGISERVIAGQIPSAHELCWDY